MVKKVFANLKDSIFSVIPIVILIIILTFFIDIDHTTTLSFVTSSIFLILGITLFTFGADISMMIIGEKIGSGLMKSGKKKLILFISFLIGVFITIAEPDLRVLASQLTSIPDIIIILVVAVGVGLFLSVAAFRIIKNISLNKILIVSYTIVLILVFFTDSSFVPVSFDSGGVTTGPISVPFIISLGLGFTMVRKRREDAANSFGLVGLCSIGPILTVMILGLVFKTESVYEISSFTSTIPLLNQYTSGIYTSFMNVIVSLVPIILVFIIFELFNNTLTTPEFKKVLIGLSATLIGLTLFLTGVNVGFIKMGYSIGYAYGLSNFNYVLIFAGMLIGFLIVIAEPAVKVLNKQIVTLTKGSISKKAIQFSLSIGVCFAVGISLLRVLTGISIMYFIIPGYILCLLLTFKTPKIFTAVAFDSGGAVSGPLTASFMLPMCIGFCVASGGNILTDAFGLVAIVAMTPMITIQILGVLYQCKLDRHDPVYLLDESIINYDWGKKV